MFYPMGSEYVFAEETYKLGLHGLTLGPWVRKVVTKYGMRATAFVLAIDHLTFFPRLGVKRKKRTVVFYARFVTPRRAFEMGILALQLVLKKYPDLEIIFHGWDVPSQSVHSAT